jgi:mannosyltransferase
MARALAHPPPHPASRLLGAVGEERRRVVVALAFATAAAAALRLPFLATQSLWFDETYTVHVVRAGSLGELWDRIGASESTPPLYYLLAWIWTHAVGSSGASAIRTVSALALISAVPVAYAALRRFVGWRAALATAALVAASPLLGWYALDARAYGLLVLTGLLSVWACSAVLEESPRGPASASHAAGYGTPRSRRLALWALAAAAAIWTHWFAGFLVLGQVVALLWLRRDAWRGTVLACGVMLLALAPSIGLLREQTGDDRASFIADAGLTDRVEQLIRQFGSGPNVPRTWLEAAMLALALAGLAVGTLLTVRRALAPDGSALAPLDADHAAGHAAAISRRDGACALLALAAVGLLVPLALAAVGLYDRFNVRNVLFLWPLAAALAAPALLQLRGVPLAALLALGVVTSLWTQSAWQYGNTDWRDAIGRVEEGAPDTPVVAVGRLGIPVASLYLHRTPATAPLSTRRAWLVVEPARSPGHRELQPLDPPLVAQLLAAFPQHREQRIDAFRVIELRAPAPVPLDPAQLPEAALFAPAASR